MCVTRVYIDGFNLYRGIVRDNRAHWLDLGKFAERLNGDQPVEKIIYCTARVSATPTDPHKANRQDTYLRAIKAKNPHVDVLPGDFSTHVKFYPLAGCRRDHPCTSKVNFRVEKGSDVNLASRLLHDAHCGRYDRAIVISGDSDLVEPIRLIVSEVGKHVKVFNPRPKPSRELQKVASEYDTIWPAAVTQTQLPESFTVGTKTYTKPPAWNEPSPGKPEWQQLRCATEGCNAMVCGVPHLPAADE